MADARAIGGDVVGDELSEERPAGRLRSERRRFVVSIAAITQAARAAKRVQKRIVCREQRKAGKETAVGRCADRCIDRRAQSGRCEAVRVSHQEILVADGPLSATHSGCGVLFPLRIGSETQEPWSIGQARPLYLIHENARAKHCLPSQTQVNRIPGASARTLLAIPTCWAWAPVFH